MDMTEIRWEQRQRIANELSKDNWRAAVAETPEELRDEMRRLCDNTPLHDLARAIDPMLAAGVLVTLNADPFESWSSLY